MYRITMENRARKRCDGGHPWVFKSSVKAVDPAVSDGDVVDAFDEGGRFVGRGFYNGRSQIALRLLTRHDENIDAAFFARRAQDAVAYRHRFYPHEDCGRIVFSESDFLPALVVDRFGDMLVYQSGCLGLEPYVPGIGAQLMELTGARGLYERNDTPVRALEGLPQRTGLLLGELNPAPLIHENGIALKVDIVNGQKTGYFLDQRENRAVLAPLCPGARVLDCFCHIGSFALHAARYGAAEVTGIDISEPAVAQAAENARINGGEDRVRFEAANAFDRLRELQQAGEQYDLIILDPPAFAKNKAALAGAARGYKQINLRALRMVRDGGFLVTCSCSHAMAPDLFMAMVNDAAHDARRRLRLVALRTQAKDHPILPGAPETQYLKCALLQVFS